MNLQEKQGPENHVCYTTSLTTTVRLSAHGFMSGLPFIYVVKAHSQHTIGVEFSSRTVKLGEKRIKLQVCSYHDACPSLSSDSVLGQLWDTAGQERFRSVREYIQLIVLL